MYFNVYSDTGDEIHGYLIPDGFSTRPRITVRHQEHVFGPFECNIFLEGPYKHKHHETGIVGFHLQADRVPGLAIGTSIEIADAETGFVFYRRLNHEQHIEQRVFRLETQFIPHRELDQSLKPFFQFYANSVERFGSETVRQTLEIINQPSTYVSGRVLLKNVQPYLTSDAVRVASLRDPFYELAIRLWSIGSFKRRRFSFFSERDAILFEPAMVYFADTNFSDLASVKRKINQASKDILMLFESPFTHQLVASSPTDRVTRDGISAALDALSQFTIFCPNEVDSTLAIDIGEYLGIDVRSLLFSPMRSPFLELSELLRSLNVLEQVLENDLILFHFIKKAEQRAHPPAD